MKNKVIFILILSLIFLSVLNADERKENIDVFILTDKSLSMENNIDSVKNYINNFIFDTIMIPGDRLNLITFYGKTESVIDDEIFTEEKRDLFKKKISGIKADGRFTDIGNALDKLSLLIPKYKNDGKIKYMLLLTDGKQEAPKESPYYSPDGSFNHAFLEHTKTIEQEGWKVHILGMGEFADVRNLAGELSATYSVLTDPSSPDGKISKSKIIAGTKEFWGIIKITSKPLFSPVDSKGRSRLTFKISSTGYDTIQSVRIEGIKTKIGNSCYSASADYGFELSPGEEKTADIPIVFDENLTNKKPGKYSAENFIICGGTTQIYPKSFGSEIKIKNFFENFFIFIAAALILLLLIILAAAISYKSKKSSKKSFKFRIFVNGKNMTPTPITLKKGEKLFINMGKKNTIDLSNDKRENSIGEIASSKESLSFNIINENFFPSGTKNIKNVLNKSVNIKNKDMISRMEIKE